MHDSDDLANRLVYHYEIKQRIASLAVADVQDGETLMIESGSCCALVALEIAKTKKNVTVITNSAFIADYIRKQGTLQIILLGGEYQQSSQVMVGPMTRRCMEPFYVDKLFIGTDGFTADSGFTGNDYMRSETVRDMAQQANHVIVVTESTKFSQKGLVHLIDTGHIHMVVSDDRIPEECEQYLTEQGVEVKKSEGIKKGASAPKRNNQYPDSGRFADNLLNLPDTGLFYASFHSRDSAFHILFAN